MGLNWEAVRIQSSCCGYCYVAVIPTIRLAELECPKCCKLNIPIEICEHYIPNPREHCMICHPEIRALQAHSGDGDGD